MPNTNIRINSAPVKLSLFAAQGPAGPAGPAGPSGPNSVTSATTSNGTASLSVSSLTTATGSVSGILNVPTAVTTTATLQVASTAFVQQELASGVAVAKNLEFLARNQSGSLIAKGSIVYINGATGNKPLITLARANNDANSAQTIGFVKTDIANNGTGFVIVRGEIESVKTFGATEGQQLYLSPTTAGAFTTTKPSAPDHLVYVGIVVAASTGAAFNGIILVAIQNGYELDEIHDVSITAPVAAGQVIKRNAGNTLWINSAIVSADVSDATSDPTPSTLVRRDANGNVRLSDVEANVITVTGITATGSIEFSGSDADDSMTFNQGYYFYGTGAASAHRTALGSGATGDQLFTSLTPQAANTILANNVVTKNADFTLAEADAGTYMRLTKTGSTQTITLPTSGISTGAEFQFYRATTQSLAFAGSATVNGSANLASVPNNGAFALKCISAGTYDFI